MLLKTLGSATGNLSYMYMPMFKTSRAADLTPLTSKGVTVPKVSKDPNSPDLAMRPSGNILQKPVNTLIVPAGPAIGRTVGR